MNIGSIPANPDTGKYTNTQTQLEGAFKQYRSRNHQSLPLLQRLKNACCPLGHSVLSLQIS